MKANRLLFPGKELGADDFTKIPNGLPGVSVTVCPLCGPTGSGKGASLANQFVAYTSTNAAKIFGLYPQKGVLQPGSDADIVIWNPDRKLTYGVAHSQHRTDYNLYEGRELTGYPQKVFLRGELIVDQEEWLGRRGMGKFLKRGPGSSQVI